MPYWTKVWPSSNALCRYIAAHTDLVAGKAVLELGAGLGLPGLLASHWAKDVIISDYHPDAVENLGESAERNGRSNVHSQLIDWHALPPELAPDVLLLSDINYEPATFEVLYLMLTDFLKKGTTILLSTPQRLLAKPFIERLLPYCLSNTEYSISQDSEQALVNVLVLCQNGLRDA